MREKGEGGRERGRVREIKNRAEEDDREREWGEDRDARGGDSLRGVREEDGFMDSRLT